MTKRKWLTALGLAATMGGLYLLYRVLSRYEADEVFEALGRIAWERIGAALAFTVCAFLCIIVLEYLAVGYTQRKVPFSRVARTAVAAIGIGHSLGVSALSSGGVRYRMYRKYGLKVKSIGQIVAFSGASVGLGVGTLGGAALFWHGDVIGELLGIPPGTIQAVAFGAWIFVLTYLVLCAVLKQPFTILSRRFRLPSWKVAGAQAVMSMLKYLFAASALYMLVGEFAESNYISVTALYIGADASALVAHVPGGWGLLEYIMTQAFPAAGVFSGILAFRAVYYLLPLFVGLAIFLLDEWRGRQMPRNEPEATPGSHAAEQA